MNFSHVSLTQSGMQVSGTYHNWGVTYGNPGGAGTIAGTVILQTLTGTFQDNAGDVTGTLSWPLDSNGNITLGTFTYGTATSFPWCGVPAGHGTPLPVGCGWSDLYNPSGFGPLILTQVADEVTGSEHSGPMAGVVSDYRLNGAVACAASGCPPASLTRFSFWMSKDGSQISGNYFDAVQTGSWYNAWCAGRTSKGTQPPSTCIGGGGIYDGTWFTNYGTVTLTQPILASSASPTASVSGLWFPWGPNPVEYPIDGGIATADPGYTLEANIPGRTHLSWSDSSPLGGATLSSSPSDAAGLTLDGFAANGVLWCGVDYGPDPFNSSPYASSVPYTWSTDPIGSLFSGCGLSGNEWTLWPPAPGGSGSPSAVGQLVERRDAVAGTTDLAGLNSADGGVVFVPPDGGSGSWTIVTGSWGDALTGDGGSFTWYPDSQDQTFSGEFTIGPTLDAGAFAWCGDSIGGTQPNPCFE
jgi:hypothetical protein